MKSNIPSYIFLTGFMLFFSYCSKKSAYETEKSQLDTSEIIETSIIVVDTITINKFENDDDACLLPRLRHTKEPENVAVAAINKEILEHFGLTSYESPSLENFVHAGVIFTWEATEDIFYFKYEGEKILGRSHQEEEEFVFDLKTGKLLAYDPIPFQALFTPSGFLEFLNKYWLEQFTEKLNESISCAEMDATCSPRKLTYEIIGNDLIVRLFEGCFPSYARACEPNFEKIFKVKDIQSFLSEAGKIIISEENHDKSKIDLIVMNSKANDLVEDVLYLFGEIDNKYAISMAIKNNKGEITGLCYYDHKKLPTELNGKINHEYIDLTEYADEKVSGYFQFILHEGFAAEDIVVRFPNGKIRYLEGGWLNADKNRMYNINFTDNISNILVPIEDQ